VGVQRKRTVYDLRWADEPGVEVAMRSCSIDGLLTLEKLAQTADADPGKAEEFLRKLAGHLVSWNLDGDDGQPLPVTYEGLVQEDLGFALKVFKGWYGAMTSVDTPLPNGSSNGHSSGLEQSLPVEPLSSPPGSS
jgi:hypothetical protein